MNPPHWIRTLMIVALLVPLGVTPGADASHLIDETALPPAPPQVPADVADTDVLVIDEILNDAEGHLHVVNETTGATYRIIRGAAEEAVDDATDGAPLPLRLFFDGAGGRDPQGVNETTGATARFIEGAAQEAGDDAMRGGFGDWKMLGDAAWAPRPEAAATGSVGHTQATEPGGVYSGGAMSLLLSPEIDLATNAYNQSSQDVPYPMAYTLLLTACKSGSFVRALPCSSYEQMLGTDPLHSLRYNLRYNLAMAGSQALDGVTVLVFNGTMPQSIDAAQDCTISLPPSIALRSFPPARCTVVIPSQGYPATGIQSMPMYVNPTWNAEILSYGQNVSYPGYSGSSQGHGRVVDGGMNGWITDTIDLGPWEGESVWIGFLFASGNTFPGYFNSTSLFDTDAGFRGVQLDDLRIRSPAAAYNLKVRTPTEPSFVPLLDSYQKEGLPTIAPGEPFTATATVVNLGTETVTPVAALRILEQKPDPDNPDNKILTLVHNANGNPYEALFDDDDLRLGPTDAVELLYWIPGLPTGEYMVQVCTARLGEGPTVGGRDVTAGDEDFCDTPPADGACSEDRLDADPCDEVALHRFNVRPIAQVDVSPVSREAAELKVGDSMTMGVTVQNRGNVEQVLDITPRVVTVSGATPNIASEDQKMLLLDNGSAEQQDPRTVALGPGESTQQTWVVRAVAAGQYHLLVDVAPAGSEPVPFDPVRDVLPEMMQPWRARPVNGTGIDPDGSIVSEPMWIDHTVEEVLSGSTSARVGNDGDRLYLRFLSSSPAATVLFGDGNANGRSGYVLGVGPAMTGMESLTYRADSLTWEEIGGGDATGPQSLGARSQGQDEQGRYAYELSIPLGVGPGQEGIRTQPGGEVKVLFRFCDPADACRHFPEGAPLRDGEGFLSPDGSLGDEWQQWHPIVLTEDNVSASPVFERRLSAGFGVDATPPAYLAAELAGSCPALVGWTTDATEFGGVRDTWNCAEYPDAGNRVSLYQGARTENPEGVATVADCEDRCYATLPGIRQMHTRPFDIPPDAQNPVLVLGHQYSTKVFIDDTVTDGPTEAFHFGHYRIHQHSMPRVVLEQWNESVGAFGAWEVDEDGERTFKPGGGYLLQPVGGYPTEAEAGTDDPRFDRSFVAPGTGWYSNTTDARGWWWPQGDQPLYQPPDKDLNTGGSFVGGSPWVTDRIPLSGSHFDTPVTVADSTVRLRFEHVFDAHPQVGDVHMNTRTEFGHGGQPVRQANKEPTDLQWEHAPLLLSPERPFTAFCTASAGNDFYYLLATNPFGCDGIVTPYDVILPGSKVAIGGTCQRCTPRNWVWQTTGGHDQIETSMPKIVNVTYSPLPDGTVLDWVDHDRDGLYAYHEPLFLNLGGTATVEERDIFLRRLDGNGASLVGRTYCGTAQTQCSPTATTANAADLVFADRDGNDAWSPTRIHTCDGNDCMRPKTPQNPLGPNLAIHDRAYLPARVLNGGHVAFDKDLDWGWRIGGLAVVEGGRVVRDVAVESARLKTAWDPVELGIGPGTTIPVEVSLRNRGLVGSTVLVDVFGEDADRVGKAGSVLCQGSSIPVQVADGSVQNVTVECTLPAAVQAERIVFRAEATLSGTTKEDFTGNNVQRVRGILPLQAVPDAAVHVGVAPAHDAERVPRTLSIRLENVGNVPLPDVTVDLHIERLTDDGPVLGLPLKWTLDDGLPLGADLLLSTRNSDAEREELVFTPDAPGTYLVKAVLSVPGDTDPDNDRATAEARALQVLYRNGLDEDLVAVPGIVTGELVVDDGSGVWSIQGNSHDGSARLLAGDPDRAEIPNGTDASVRLPTIDLGAVKDATLSFRHRYDLEEGFDAARVEVSSDGGETWVPMVPKPQNGLPEGYPSTPLIGANAILGDDVELDAMAYTGRSGDLPGNQDGWITAEYDLTTQSEFLVDASIQEFPLEGLAVHADPQPLLRDRTDGPPEVQFTHLDPSHSDPVPPFWGIDEPNWFQNEQYWWIDNRTHAEPAPRHGQTMWWSGSAGVSMASENPPKVATGLTLDIDPTAWTDAPAAGEDVVLSWWDWRAGWRDGSDREGTGGRFLMVPASEFKLHDTDGDGLFDHQETEVFLTDPDNPDTDGDGWCDGCEVYSLEHPEEETTGTDPLDSGDKPVDEEPAVPDPEIQEPDGLPDAWERHYFGDRSRQPVEDLDEDGFSNLDELRYGTHPLDRDTDGDTVSDLAEVSLGMDPLVARKPEAYALQTTLVETHPSGWSRREATLSDFEDDGIVFLYLSGEESLRVSELQVPVSQIENNRGWFLEGAQVLAYGATDPVTGARPARELHAFPLDGLELDATNQAGDWSSSGNDPILWTLVGRGGAARDGGWHVGEAELNGTPVPAWRFASDDPEGYPAGADSRLVTPRVDLRNYAGQNATLRFDHKYAFHGQEEGLESDNFSASPPGGPVQDFTQTIHSRAIDFGAVVYQTYDADTDTYGPWQPLLGVPDQELPFVKTLDSGYAKPDSFTDSGYPAVAPVPPKPVAVGGPWVRGVGADLETSTGQIRPVVNHPRPDLSSDGLAIPRPWQEYPFVYAFTGTQDWSTVEWDVSRFIGQEVRFGFHAWTNPSDHPCSPHGTEDHRDAPSWGLYFDIAKDGAARKCRSENQDPGGWTIANVALEGKTFQGGPADIRFRVATDGSFTKGEWSLDDVTVVGTRYKQNLRIETDEPTMLAEPGSRLEIDGSIRNVGNVERTGLAVVATAEVVDAGLSVPLELAKPTLAKVTNDLPEGSGAAWGPFDLGPGGGGGDALPFTLALDLPGFPSTVEIRLRMAQRTCDDCPSYEFVRNEAGASTTTWVVEVEDRLDVRLASPPEDHRDTIEVSPPISAAGDQVTLRAEIANHGNVEPDAGAPWTATWTVHEIQRKGGDQQGVEPEDAEEVAQGSQEVASMPRGTSVPLALTFVPAADGLYRVSLDVDLGDGAIRSSKEFLVGEAKAYYRVDFADGTDHGWEDASPMLGTDGGGSPPQVAFRQVGDRFLWGVTEEQSADGQTYCSFGGCNYGASSRGSNKPPVRGLHGVATTDTPVDLGRVPNDRAVLTLRHAHAFEDPGDGARLEVLPLQTPGGAAPRAAFQCSDSDGGRQDMWFAIAPADASTHQAVVLSANGWNVPRMTPTPPYGSPQRINPINERETDTSTTSLVPSKLPALGGAAVDGETVQYFLDQEPKPFCPPDSRPTGDLPSSLINYTLQLRLNVGTFPGFTWNCEQSPIGVQHATSQCRANGPPPSSPNAPRTGRPGATGWQIDAISVSSVEVDVSPDHRTLPLRDGYAKRFSFMVTNDGSVPERFRVVFDEQQSQGGAFDASWLHFPQQEIVLAPGQTRPFYFDVEVPQEPAPPRGSNLAVLHMVSASDPNVRDTIRLDLVLGTEDLPDLVVQLATDEPGPVPDLEQDTTVTLSMTVRNLGLKESEPVALRTEVEREGAQNVVTEGRVGRLCPEPACGDGSRQTVTFEWQVPHEVGNYTLHTQVDPDGRLVEVSRAQNNVSMLVRVVPLQRPDVAVTSLSLDGVQEDGYAREGSLVRIHANVTNQGVAPATDVQVRVLSGTATLVETTLEALAPGETRTVTAVRVASRGETVVRVLVPPGGDDTDISNNELRRVLRVRGLELELTPDPGAVPLAPGGTGSVRVEVANHGNVAERLVLGIDPDHAGWGIAASPNPVTVASGSTAWTLVTLQAPPEATAGRHNITVTASPQSLPGSSLAAVVPVDVAQRVDAPVLSLAANMSSDALRVHLESRSNVPEDLRIVLVAPTDWVLAPTNVTLPAGAQRSVDLDVEVPPHTPPGPVLLVVQATDAAGDVRAEGQGNVTVMPLVNGTAAWMGGTSEPTPDDLSARVLSYTLRVENTGNVPFRPNVVATELPAPATQVENISAPLLAPGDSTTVELRIQAPSTAVEMVNGRVAVWARTQAPPNATLAVMDLPSLTHPDLVVETVRITPRGSVAVDDPVRIVVAVANRGIVESPGTSLFAFVNGDLVKVQDVPPLGAGEEHQVNLTWTFQGPGGHLVHMQANGRGDVEEMYADNNGKSVVVEVTQSAAGRLAGQVDDVDVPSAPALLPVLLLLLAAALVRRRSR